MVTVTVEWAPSPVDEATVFFLRSDDSVIDIVSTDADGRAQAFYEEPGAVVIQIGVGVPTSQQALLAYLDVPPGTDIYSGADALDRSGTVTVSGPEAEGALTYQIETACGIGGSLTPTVTADLASCEVATHVVWVARALVGGQYRTFSAFLPSMTVQDGRTASVPGPLRADLLQTTRVTGVPEAVSVDVAYRLRSDHGVVQEGPSHDSLVPEDDSVELVDAFHDLRGVGLMGRVLASVQRPGGNVTTFAAWVEHDGTPDIDLAPVSPASVEGSVFDRSTATWSWTEGNSGLVTGVRGMVVVQEEGEQLYSWRVVAPSGRPLRVPRLPSPFTRFNVDPDSNATGAGFELLGHTRGYGALLADLEGMIDLQGQAGDIAAVTSGGASVIE
jgi:hypothetical protein